MANRPDWLLARPVAHRGLHHLPSGVLENTRSAVEAAASRDLAIEVDVQLSRDGEAMVFHDGNLSRLTGHDVPIDDLGGEELQALPLKGSNDRISTLWEILQTVQSRVPVFIEIKNDDPVRPDDHLLQRTIEVVRAYGGPVALMSFDPGVYRDIRKLAPDLPRGIVADATLDLTYYGKLKPMERFRRRHLLRAFSDVPDFIAYDIHDLPAPGPALLRAIFDVPLLAWTVRTKQERRTASSHADQIIFEGFDPRAG